MSTPSEPQELGRAPARGRLHLTLFINEASPSSVRSVRRLRDLCDRHIPYGYDLKIVDIYKQPEEVFARGVLALPTLIKEKPPPRRVLIGDFTDEGRVLAALGLPVPKKAEP